MRLPKNPPKTLPPPPAKEFDGVPMHVDKFPKCLVLQVHKDVAKQIKKHGIKIELDYGVEYVPAKYKVESIERCFVTTPEKGDMVDNMRKKGYVKLNMVEKKKTRNVTLVRTSNKIKWWKE